MILTLLTATLPLFHSQKPNVFRLEDLNLSGIEQGWGEPGKDHSVENHPLTLNGQVFTHGLGTHAESSFTVGLKGKALEFQATVGVDDETHGKGSVVFVVNADGRTLARVKALPGQSFPIRVSLRGEQYVRLVVEDGGDGNTYDHADWADAVFVMAPGSKPFTGAVTPDGPMAIAHVKAGKVQIHGARIVGTTPGHDFLFRIPATSALPIWYRVTGLPSGLTLDANTGIIRGRVAKAGTYALKVTAQSRGSIDRRVIKIVAGLHKLALTPPMGWNSWNVWAGAVDSDKIRAAANAFIKTGLASHGYTYVNIDDCWEAGRSDDGEIQANQKFPDMAELARYVHSKGLKVGLYSSPGPKTCAGFTASWQHEAQDARTYAKWGFDYLKYDWCSYGGIAPSPDLAGLQKPYLVMSKALDESGRDIVFSLCQYGMGDVFKWGKSVGGNVWRTTGDITDTWSSMSSIGFSHSPKAMGAGPGGWNDPDMLVVGHLGWGDHPRPTRLTQAEQMTHIGMWSLLGAPLIIGCDLTQIDGFTSDLLMNHDVIEVDQDPLGKVATLRAKHGDIEIWTRPLFDGSQAVGIFNRGPEATVAQLTGKELGYGRTKISGRNLWLNRELGPMHSYWTAKVPRHGMVLLKVWPTGHLAN